MKAQKESSGKKCRRIIRGIFGIKKKPKENYIELNIKAHGHGKARESNLQQLFWFHLEVNYCGPEEFGKRINIDENGVYIKRTPVHSPKPRNAEN